MLLTDDVQDRGCLLQAWFVSYACIKGFNWVGEELPSE